MNTNRDNTQTPSQSVTNETTTKAIAAEADKLIAVGQQRIHVNAVTTKIRDDIAFLEDRIKRMETMKAPSETVLNTYRAMLTSRKSVLSWLEEHNMIASDSTADKTGT